MFQVHVAQAVQVQVLSSAPSDSKCFIETCHPFGGPAASLPKSAARRKDEKRYLIKRFYFQF
jgi:hypothetical protein